VRAEGEVDIARGALARALGLSAATPLRLADLPAAEAMPLPELRALLETAQVRRPDLAEAAARVTEAEAETRRLAAGNRPRVSVSAAEELQRFDDQGDVAGRLSLTLSWPFYDGGAVRARTRAASARTEAATARGANLGLEAELEVWRAFHRLTTERAAIEHANEALAAAEHAERAQLSRYKAGLSDIVALLAAQATLAEARRQEIQARFSHQQARVELARAAGHLDPDDFPRGLP
jgi:outer membrane protein TolC